MTTVASNLGCGRGEPGSNTSDVANRYRARNSNRKNERTRKNVGKDERKRGEREKRAE